MTGAHVPTRGTAPPQNEVVTLARRCAAEFIGTALLVIAGVGTAVLTPDNDILPQRYGFSGHVLRLTVGSTGSRRRGVAAPTRLSAQRYRIELAALQAVERWLHPPWTPRRRDRRLSRPAHVRPSAFELGIGSIRPPGTSEALLLCTPEGIGMIAVATPSRLRSSASITIVAMPDDLVLVTGGTGKVGRRVALQLQARGAPTRVASRSRDIRFDWNEPGTWDAAIDGVVLALLVPPDGDPVVAEFARRSAERGVRKLVLLSARGVTTEGYFDDQDILAPRFLVGEDGVRSSGVPHGRSYVRDGSRRISVRVSFCRRSSVGVSRSRPGTVQRRSSTRRTSHLSSFRSCSTASTTGRTSI